MRKARQSGFERLETYLVKLIQEKDADRDQPGAVRALLACLKALSLVFAAVVGARYLLYRIGILRRFPLGVQVISIGNVTADAGNVLLYTSDSTPAFSDTAT